MFQSKEVNVCSVNLCTLLIKVVAKQQVDTVSETAVAYSIY